MHESVLHRPVPQTVTVFLDKDVKVDIDKVKIEIPVEAPAPGAVELKPGELPAAPDAKATEAAEKDAQSKIDDLFKEKK